MSRYLAYIKDKKIAVSEIQSRKSQLESSSLSIAPPRLANIITKSDKKIYFKIVCWIDIDNVLISHIAKWVWSGLASQIKVIKIEKNETFVYLY